MSHSSFQREGHSLIILRPTESHQDDQFNSLQFSLSVVSDSLRPHGLQHARPPCPSPTPGACSNSCPLRQWCHPTISSSVIPFSHLQPFPASGSFPISQFFESGGQSIGVSASASVLPMNIQDWFPLGWTGWMRLPEGQLKKCKPCTYLDPHQQPCPWTIIKLFTRSPMDG